MDEEAMKGEANGTNLCEAQILKVG